MPHECTNCGRTFPDGSKEMLSGCPDCGGNKFQFAPSARAATGSGESAAASATDSASEPGGTAAGTADDAGTVERAAETVRDWVSSDTDRSANSSTTGADDPPTDASEPAAGADGTQPTADGKPSRAGGTQPTADSRSSGADGTQRDRSTGDRADRSWPSSDDPADGAEAAPAGQFEEWPETARRPEDRSATETEPSAASTSSTEPSAVSSSANAATDAANASGERSIMADTENDAQADARTEVVSTNDLPDESPQSDQVTDAASDGATRAAESVDGDDAPPSDGRVVSEPSGEQPSIEELREELNEQFESIKIVSPGQYELNLMELYNREEYIISLQEDGRYVIDVPDSWREGEE